MATCPGRRRLDQAREGTPGRYEEGDPVNLRLGVLRIGDVALASVDGEIYSPIGKRVKEESAMANTVVVTLANGMANSGYVPNDAVNATGCLAAASVGPAMPRSKSKGKKPIGMDGHENEST